MIDSLVRKPGAFPRYRYREEFFPSHVFRIAYDRLTAERSTEHAADKAYLRILHLAAFRSESQVEAALHSLLNRDTPLDAEAVETLMDSPEAGPEGLVSVPSAGTERYDGLLSECEAQAAEST